MRNRRTILASLQLLIAAAVLGQDQSSPEKAKHYSIAGPVKRPGTYPLNKRVTVFDAIIGAGGFADIYADQQDIKIIRGSETLHFSYSDYVAAKNRETNKNIELEDGDVIVVRKH